ncbi:DUF5686 and carboxypeptidase-like regulatory domain-containing protein [Sphingobacterium rhinopitheci]|uniref:DUF5686 and carboxypeptidase-like regulatory domain-containing protein n=1 Tax=Sphingobacterium rhinopitheci TaxID=2781960 RepID=UPI001F5258E0|nr:DUF5686 and carboxypeptidase-like regulatory domain-containing protein [Sphingobacterium rhinopitheci]MCI0922555.1 carboxypeptidase-like regulatory domain-containing protein [Sphingobacterium rhinopitheci]
MKQLYINSIITVLAVFLSFQSFAQELKLRGRIIDKQTEDPISFATIAVVGGSQSTHTDDNGNFNLTVPSKNVKVRVSYVGYTPQMLPLESGEITFDIALNPENSIEEVVVKRPKLKYSNKNNPAVELIRQVIAHRDENRLTGQEYVQYEQYEKVSLGLSNLSPKFKDGKAFKKFQFLFQQDDSAKTEKYILPAYIEEKVSQFYFRNDPKKYKQYIIAEQKAEFDPKFVDNNGLSNYFNKLYDKVDIYDNNISLLTNQFLSPIANSAPTFYRFYITDTIKTSYPYLVELSFYPRTKTDFLFQGKLYITLDGQYAVQSAKMKVNDDINLNFVRDLNVELAFEKDNLNKYYLSKSSLGIDFSLTGKGKGIRGNRMVYIKNYINGKKEPDSIYAGPDIVLLPPTKAGIKQDSTFWASLRHEPLSSSEVNIYKNIDTLQLMPSFKRFMDISALVLSGYKQAGPVEIGPVNTFYSYNSVEGLRLRLGGRTTDQLSTRFYAETYAAYGTKDKQWKYFISGTYSLNNKSVYKYPQHYVRASFQRDTKIPGQNLEFIQEDNVLLSFKRGESDSYLYNDIFKLDYKAELKKNFAITAGLSKWRQKPAGVIEYIIAPENAPPITINELNTTEASIGFRWAPNEEFYQGKLYRTPIFNKYPIFTFNYTAGLKGVLDGEYNYHNFTAGVFKRLYLSQFGYADINVDGTYILGKNIPFPLLTIHRANQTYAYQLNSYNLMNFMEFISDHNASLNLQYYMNGFILNKIPLLRRLQWREVFSFKAIYGGLREENNPTYNDQVYKWQTNSNGDISSFTFTNEPYMEASIGLSNIFKILRVDYVHRLNYLDQPNVPNWGIRARFKFDF